jgi:hypothetical protein
MEVFPLDQGDPAWVFGDDYDDTAVHQALSRAAEQLIALASDVHGRLGWSGAGLEYHRLPGSPQHGTAPRTLLIGSVQAPHGTEFETSLAQAQNGFEVDTEIAVRCDAEIDCGMHTVLALPTAQSPNAAHAAEALLTATQWLHQQAISHQPNHWRDNDPRARHP